MNRNIYKVVVVNNNTMKIKCSKCGHEWETKSKLKYVTCPSCQLKIKREGSEVKNE